jgi:hypothetical protein
MIGSLPFTNLNLDIRGVLRFEDEELILEWHRVNVWLFQSDEPHQVRIPLSHLDSIVYKNPFYLFHAVLQLRVRSLETLARVPGSNGAEIALYCRKRDRQLAQDIANTVTFQKLEQVFPEAGTPACVRSRDTSRTDAS